MELRTQDEHSGPLTHAPWIVRLHWFAVFAFVLVAVMVYLVRPYHIAPLLWLITIPTFFNGTVAVYHRVRERRACPLVRPGEELAVFHTQLIVDMVTAAVAIHISGGVESVLIPVYLAIVPASALLVSRRATFAYASLAAGLLGAVFGLQYAGLIAYTHALFFDTGSPLFRNASFVGARWAFLTCFLYVSAYLASYISARLEDRRRELVQLRLQSDSIVDAIEHGIVVVDKQGRILRFNRFMREAYGWTDDDLNRSIFAGRPDLEEAGLGEEFDAIVRQGEVREYRNLQRVSRQGEEVHQNLAGYPLRRDGGIIGAVIVIEDVTQQAHLELSLQAQIARRETIAQLSHRISSILELDQLLDATVTLVAEAFDYYNVAIFLHDESRGELVLQAEAGQRDSSGPDDYRQAVGEGMVGWVAESGEPLVSNDVRREPHYVSYLPDTRSELDIPLTYGGDVLGVLDVQSTQLNAFGSEDVATLEILADQIAVAIENARLYAAHEGTEQALRRRADELSVLHETALAGAEAADRDDLIQRITQILATTLYQENVGFLMLDNEGKHLRPHPSYHGVTQSVREVVLPLDNTSICATVAESGEALVISNVRADERYFEASPTVNSELCVPVRVEREVVGVINVESPEEDGFSQEDLRLVSTVAEHVGTALARLRLFSEMRRRNEELAARNVIARAVSRSLDVDDVLQQLYREVDQLLAPDTFFVALYDEGDESFDVALVVEEGEPLPPFSAAVGEDGGLTAWVLKERRPLLIRDLSAEGDGLPADPQHLTDPARSWLGVPLVARDRVVGVLSVQSFEPKAFDKRDEQFLSAVADQVAVAIDNARLYEETRRMAFTDSLTGLYNARHFYQALEEEVARSERYGHAVSVIMLDLDDFKRYNDRYGHLAGDDLLKELAGLLSQLVRRTDIVARYGGEEFAIILPETASDDAARLAERVRVATAQHDFDVQDDQGIGHITVSAGVASFPRDAAGVKELVHSADMSLLRAKERKNRVCTFSSSASSSDYG